jgi:hypothetical protein
LLGGIGTFRILDLPSNRRDNVCIGAHSRHRQTRVCGLRTGGFRADGDTKQAADLLELLD